jgi:hypothetical protein
MAPLALGDQVAGDGLVFEHLLPESGCNFWGFAFGQMPPLPAALGLGVGLIG